MAEVVDSLILSRSLHEKGFIADEGVKLLLRIDCGYLH